MNTYIHIQKAGWQVVWMTLACDPGGGTQGGSFLLRAALEEARNERQTQVRRRQYGFLEGKMIPDILKA